MALNAKTYLKMTKDDWTIVAKKNNNVWRMTHLPDMWVKEKVVNAIPYTSIFMQPGEWKPILKKGNPNIKGKKS